MIWWLSGSIVLNLVLVWVTRNMLLKNEYAEEYIADLLNLSLTAIDNMREVDQSGAFESDDEIGVTFRALNAVMKDYAEVLGVPQPKDGGAHGENS